MEDKQIEEIDEEKMREKEEMIRKERAYLLGRHNGKMRDYYRIADCLGAGAFGEVRKCVYREKSSSKSFYK